MLSNCTTSITRNACVLGNLNHLCVASHYYLRRRQRNAGGSLQREDWQGTLFRLHTQQFRVRKQFQNLNTSRMHKYSIPLHFPLVGTTKHGPSLRILATCRALGLSRFDRGPERLIKWNSKGFGAGGRGTLVLGLGANNRTDQHKR